MLETKFARLGRTIAEARRRAGMSQAQLADAVDLSYGYIGLIELGKRRPFPEKLRVFARVLGIPSAELFEAAGHKDAPEYDAIPGGVLTIVRRLLNSGMDVAAFERLEEVARLTLLHPTSRDGTESKRDG